MVLQPRTRPTTEALKLALVMTRQRTSLMERAFLSEGPHLRFCRRNWVHAWVDDGHVVYSETPGLEARRAITRDGQLIWMVHQPGKRDAFHAEDADPVSAMDAARQARSRRRAIRSRWSDGLALRRAVLSRQIRLTVRISDAAEAGLCALGISGFMRRMGMGQREEVPGLWVALSSFADEQALFALMAAAERTGTLAKVTADATTAMAP